MDGSSRTDRADDAALLAGLAVGDAAAATAFVRRFQRAVFGMALRVTRDPVLAEDVSQEAFLRAWRAAQTYDVRRASVLTWLLTITRNVAIDAVRARRAAPVEDEDLERLLRDVLDPSEDQEDAVLNRVEAERAVRLLHGISPPQARAVVLAVFGGCTAAEVAARESIPLGTAKTRIRDGLRRLRSSADPARDERAREEAEHD